MYVNYLFIIVAHITIKKARQPLPSFKGNSAKNVVGIILTNYFNMEKWCSRPDCSRANRAILPKNLFNAQGHNGVIPATLGKVVV